MSALAARAAGQDLDALAQSLDLRGYALLPGLLTAHECATLAAGFDDEAQFRSHIRMARHGFGAGEYKYYAYPLPAAVATLRETLYAPLAPIANRWRAALGQAPEYPAVHAEYQARCHARAQTRPTPLLLRYTRGDYNCLHQDLYGEEVFPLQVAILLSAPGTDFTGGEFVLTEQRPRMQSKVEVVPLARGDAVVFAVNERPVRGSRGSYRVRQRHGVSRVLSGQRSVLGVIFHDAH